MPIMPGQSGPPSRGAGWFASTLAIRAGAASTISAGMPAATHALVTPIRASKAAEALPINERPIPPPSSSVGFSSTRSVATPACAIAAAAVSPLMPPPTTRTALIHSETGAASSWAAVGSRAMPSAGNAYGPSCVIRTTQTASPISAPISVGP